MAGNETRDAAEGPLHQELVEHLLQCMEQTGMVIEAATAPGHPRPAAVTRLGLRPRRWRPAAVARDGRRTIMGDAMTEAEIRDPKASDRLRTLARHCRTLILCIPGSTDEEALESLLRGADMPHAKGRLLRFPRESWEELPKPGDPRRART